MTTSIPINLSMLIADMVTVGWNDRSSIRDCDFRVREAVAKELAQRSTRWVLVQNALPSREHGFGPKEEVLWLHGPSHQPLKLAIAPYSDEKFRKSAKMWLGLPKIEMGVVE